MNPRVLALCACSACAPERAELDCGADRGVLVATTDFSVGALATIEGDELRDRLATVNGDPIVRSSGGAIFQANRTTADTLRRYAPGELCRPLWEVALPPKSNVHDVAWIGEYVWVARYDQPEITRHDPETGELIDRVPLDAVDELDGNPDLERVIEVDGRVLAAAQRFDRSEVPWISTGGAVVELDPVDGAVLHQWEVGPSPRLFPHPSDPARVVLATGVYGVADGGVGAFDPATGATEPWVDEVELGRDIEGFAGLDGFGVLWSSDLDLDEGGGAALDCLDLQTLARAPGPAGPGWYVDGAPGEGVVWIARRRGWGDAVEPGVFAVDPALCARSGPLLRTSLEPYSLAPLPPG